MTEGVLKTNGALPAKGSSAFFKTLGHRSLMLLVLLLVCADLVLFIGLWQIKINQPQADYFIIQPDGKMANVKPLGRPNVSQTQLLLWVMEASTAAYTFDFLNLETQLEAVRPYFTTAGFDSFRESLEQRNMINDVYQGKLIVSAVATGLPVVVNEYSLRPDSYTWVVQMPIRISFQSANEVRFVDTIESLKIERIPTVLSPRGVGISQIQLGGG